MFPKLNKNVYWLIRLVQVLVNDSSSTKKAVVLNMVKQMKKLCISNFLTSKFMIRNDMCDLWRFYIDNMQF